MRKLFAIFSILILSMGVIGCTDAVQSNLTSLGSKFTITVYSVTDGSILKEYVSTGKVSTVTNSDGWEFRDSKDGKFVRISGGLIEVREQ